MIYLCFYYLFIGTEDDHQDYEYLVSWGSHFDKLADMYSRDGEHELDEER